MSTSRQGMSFEEMEQVVAQRVSNAIETIAIYELKIRMAHDSMNQVVRKEATVGKNVSNKRKWGSDHGRDSDQQQSKMIKVVRAHATGAGNSLNRKEFIVFNSRTRIVAETLHIRFSENTPNNVGSRPNWLFDIDVLTKTMNYQPVVACTQSNALMIVDAALIPGFRKAG
nr:hypothetical protein [Tanacetum cinerariifolium]